MKQRYVAQAVADCRCSVILTDTTARMTWCPLHKAAPQLLEALEHLVAALDIETNIEYMPEIPEARDVARAAIALANLEVQP